MNNIHTFDLLQASQAIAGTQNYPKSSLYLVPTPIGNLADITFRALHTLSIADSIACEDTRHAQHLLNQYGIKRKQLFSLHQHNEHEATQQILKNLENEQRVALITDAGTPAISDPGARAVQLIQKTGFRIIPLPGASSIITALSAAGLTDASTLFHGFLSHKVQERHQELKTILTTPYAIILLEAPHRIKTLFTELAHHAPDRTITVGRELTKQFEQIVTTKAIELPTWLELKPEHNKGEFVCIAHAPDLKPEKYNLHDEALQEALTHLPTKAAASLIAKLTGASKNQLYQRALELKNM